jgi:hypothetical protein
MANPSYLVISIERKESDSSRSRGTTFDSETLKEGLFAEIAFKHRRVEYHLRG